MYLPFVIFKHTKLYYETMHRPLQELKFQPPAESNLLAPSANTLLYIRIVFLFYIISDGY